MNITHITYEGAQSTFLVERGDYAGLRAEVCHTRVVYEDSSEREGRVFGTACMFSSQILSCHWDPIKKQFEDWKPVGCSRTAYEAQRELEKEVGRSGGSLEPMERRS